MPETALIIVARYPQAGQVKTRLAAHVGEDVVLSLYRAFLEDLASRFAGWQYDLHWAYTPAEQDFAGMLREMLQDQVDSMFVFPQEGDALGERLHHAFRTLEEKRYERIILIGSDTPQLSRAFIEQAEQALASHDVVLGPSEDGGYYLLAMRAAHDLFTGIPMSTDEVLAQTLARAHLQGLSVYLLEPLFDIDTYRELVLLADLLAQDGTLAPATAAYLCQIQV